MPILLPVSLLAPLFLVAMVAVAKKRATQPLPVMGATFTRAVALVVRSFNPGQAAVVFAHMSPQAVRVVNAEIVKSRGSRAQSQREAVAYLAEILSVSPSRFYQFTEERPDLVAAKLVSWMGNDR